MPIEIWWKINVSGISSYVCVNSFKCVTNSATFFNTSVNIVNSNMDHSFINKRDKWIPWMICFKKPLNILRNNASVSCNLSRLVVLFLPRNLVFFCQKYCLMHALMTAMIWLLSKNIYNARVVWCLSWVREAFGSKFHLVKRKNWYLLIF